MEDQKKHAILSPSSADRWMTCLGSTALSQGYPDTQSEAALEGTEHHEVAAVCLDDGLDPMTLVGRPLPITERPLTKDNAEAVKKYVDFARAHVDEDGIFLAEEVIPLTHLTGEPEAEGTSDFVVLRTDRELVVGDLKFGRGIEVSPERNRQMMIYALGVIEKHQVQEDYDTVRLFISQPRSAGNSDWVISMADLLAFGEEVKAVSKQISRVTAEGVWELIPDLPLTPSEKACQFCKAKGKCPALAGAVAGAMTDGFEALDAKAQEAAVPLLQTPPTESQADRLGRFGNLADLAEIWIKGVRRLIEAELLAGGKVTDHKLVQGKKGNRQWTSADEAEALLKGFRLKRDEMYEFSLISPTAAAKLLEDKPKRWEKVLPLITQKPGGISVAKASDKRAEWIPAPASDGFEAVTTDNDISDLM